jgi:hypothetical protein
MLIMRNRLQLHAVTSFLFGALVGACSNSNSPTVNGTCAIADSTVVDCGENGQPGSSIGLVGYSCTGGARPDDNPTYIEGVPQGLLCADRASAGADAGTDGIRNYCCSAHTTTCAFNPVAICTDPGAYGFQCRGADRPEALNPAISCTQGVYEGDLINYCCSGTTRAPTCQQSDAVDCLAGMTGWVCPTGTEPTAQDMGANKSRADVYYLLCPNPTPSNNVNIITYCCYTPALTPAGGTCIQDLKVPGCAAGRFGISCYGPDTPEQNYPELTCPAPGVAGQSAYGYPATVYCCDFKQQTQ